MIRVPLAVHDLLWFVGMSEIISSEALIPVLPIRNAVLFPLVPLPLLIGRLRSLKAVEMAQAQGPAGLLVVVTQQNMTTGDPEPPDLYRTGTLCRIENAPLPNDPDAKLAANVSTIHHPILVTGISRFRVREFVDMDNQYFAARGEILSEHPVKDAIKNEAIFFHLKTLVREILELVPGTTEPLLQTIDRIDDPLYLGYICSAYLNLGVAQKQKLLEIDEVAPRLETLLTFMQRERDVLILQKEMRDKLSERLTKAQREVLLREQLRTIRSELGDEAGEETLGDLESRILKSGLTEEASRQARDELRRLKSMSSNSTEYQVARTYVEWLADLPWKTASNQSLQEIDLGEAQKILDEDHYGLESVKKRIIEYLAVSKLKNDLHGPILCLMGPPGVGKTSLGQSIARALGKRFVRASLGGVRDEAEIRGHRRTYVGAMPGRIIQCIKRAGTRNSLMMLDEIDKLFADFHGDPSAALLEVLDPEQNRTFVDHYIDVAFDLSGVFFIATGNVVDTIPPALRDRMEMIEVSGYTSFEKIQIAKRHLIPALLSAHGIKPEWVEIEDSALERLISRYTREAGVRDLKRKIAEILRSIAVGIIEKMARMPDFPPTHVTIAPGSLGEILGAEKYFPEVGRETLRPGISIALAWTPHGGEILYIEAAVLPFGHGKLTLTGQLGDVMKESAMIAVTLARHQLFRSGGRGSSFRFQRHDIHLHVPAGAISKDGPSAGLAILAAIFSWVSDRPVRRGIAMTGEITLRGWVMPVGGIKEKVLAAHRAGCREVILPRMNQQDLREIPIEVREQIQFSAVDTIEEAIERALEPPSLETQSRAAAA